MNNARLKEMLPELEAAILAESDETRRAAQFGTGVAVDAETRERLELRQKSTIGAYFAAAMKGTQIAGPEAELSEAYGCPGAVPLEMFRTEKSGPATNTGA